MSTKDINIEYLKEFRKKKAKKNSDSKNVINIHVKDTGPPDISNRDAILKIFKSTEAYEAFRSKYLYNDFSYTLDQEDRSIEIMRNRCKKKKRRQENMYRQAVKNKNTLSKNENLCKTIFSEKNYYNNYSKEQLDYEAAKKLLNQSKENYKDLEYDDNNNDMDNINMDKFENYRNNNTLNELNEEDEQEEENEEDRNKEKMEIDENNTKENEEEEDNDYIKEKYKIVEDIDRNMVEKNSSYKSFSFNDSLKPNESKKSSNDSGGTRFPPYNTNFTTSSSTRVPLCMDDLIQSSPVKLPVIQPKRRKDWQALSLTEVSEKRPVWNPFSNEPKKKFIIPGIEKQYQQYIPSRKGNAFWKICDGNIYENIF